MTNDIYAPYADCARDSAADRTRGMSWDCRPCRLPALPVLLVLLVLLVLTPAVTSGEPITASFTDSQHRTVLFRYELGEDQDPNVPQGILLYFHGSATGAQEQVVHDYFVGLPWYAAEFGLVPVAVASPETVRLALGDDNRYRVWYPADLALIHELLQSDFGGRIRVDDSRVFFWGHSAGTCFLNQFVPRFGAHYGGGLLALCGCIRNVNRSWTPLPAFVGGFRVFVGATTGDFLYPESVSAYGYYRYTVGLETRGDLARGGPHCAAGDVSIRDALAWLVHGTGLSEEPEHIHMERVAPMDFVAGMSVDDDGVLWIARQAPGLDPTLWRSVDRGLSLAPISSLDLRVWDLDAVGGMIFVTEPTARASPLDESPLNRSDDQGRTFESVALPTAPATGAKLVTDRAGHIYFPGKSTGNRNEIYRSEDLGISWSPLDLATGDAPERLVNDDLIASEGQTDYLFTTLDYFGDHIDRATIVKHVGTTTGGDWSVVSAPKGENIQWMTWDGDLFWGTTWDSVYTSTDRGQTWTEVELPMHDIRGRPFALVGGRPMALGHGQVYFRGPSWDGYLRDDRTAWTRIYGSDTFGSTELRNHLAVDHTTGDVYFSPGTGVFRLDARFRSVNGPRLPTDSDGDGIPDVRDLFPDDVTEYLDTDGDGVGNGADADDDGDGVPDHEDGAPLDHRGHLDTDADGLGNHDDLDDDGDGILDGVDAFPLDGTRSSDSDGDGMDDYSDDDDDDDGVADTADAFPRDAGEWADTDEDGIGDNLDPDDDNDGRDDEHDAAPTFARPALRSLRPFSSVSDLGSGSGSGFHRQSRHVALHSAPRSGIVYPAAEGMGQRYGEVTLLADSIEFMIDDFGGYGRAHVDRNGNGNLTDDGPSSLWEAGRLVGHWVHAHYPPGAVVPYLLGLELNTEVEGGAPALNVFSAAFWLGEIDVLGGRTVPVSVFDFDADGLYTGSDDYVCVDVDGDAHRHSGCYGGPDSFTHGDTFTMDGQKVQVLVANSGNRVEIGPPGHAVPYVPAASHPDWQGFVRVANRGRERGTVRIHAFDDAGNEHGPASLDLPGGATRHINSGDLEQGNAAKGFPIGVGDGDGGWRLQLQTDLDLDVLTYVRTTDGFLTSMHDVAVRDNVVTRVPIMNPGRNLNQQSLLRLVNPGNETADVSIRGIDDDGRSTGHVDLSVEPRGARMLTALELETGADGIVGSLGRGSGKWRLEITSRMPLHAMSLLRSPGGHLTNLSTPPYEDGGPLHHVALFPAAGNPMREGFVRVVNRSPISGTASIIAYDDAGIRRGPATLDLRPHATVHFNSDDLEEGNAAKGLTEGIGGGVGAWRLELESNLDLDVLGYVRTTDGFLTSIHDVFHRGEGGVHVPTVNPASNPDQVSELRLINPADDPRNVTVVGVDDAGCSPGTVVLTIPPQAARTFTSAQLESGSAAGLEGALGDGTGKWRLEISSDGPLRVMSLLKSPLGHLTNLSTIPRRFPSRKLESMNARQGERPIVCPPVVNSITINDDEVY